MGFIRESDIVKIGKSIKHFLSKCQSCSKVLYSITFYNNYVFGCSLRSIFKMLCKLRLYKCKVDDLFCLHISGFSPSKSLTFSTSSSFFDVLGRLAECGLNVQLMK